MQPSSSSGTRDKNRAETFRRIHEAAADLVGRDGLAAATVQDIAERAGVSRRTFFNYYPTKEDAVLGLREPFIPSHALNDYLDPDALELDETDALAGKGPFVRALNLTVATLASNGAQPTSELQSLISAHPELLDRLRAHRDATQELLVTVLTEKVSEQTSSPRAADTARALILLAGAVIRFAYHDDPGILDDPDAAAITSAVQTFRDTLKEIR